jgi:hypothetical protein
MMRSKPLALAIAAALLASDPAMAIRGVNPTGVNVRSNAPNTVFLTFQGLEVGERAVEALWCGELKPGVPGGAVTDFDPCVPGTLFGRLPLAFDRARPSVGIGQTNLTDIMTIPASVVRRAVQEGIEGRNSDFFYVRRFAGGSGGDKWVVVTCRLGAGGARSPLSLTDVRLAADAIPDATRLLGVRPGERLPRVSATIQFNGTGQLKGRWELVRPGDPEPEPSDLLPEAALPLELRLTQRRYLVVSRFSQFLPPTGIARIEGPDPALLDTRVEGPYQLLLRIEATDDREANSEIGAGVIVKSGGVAGFPMPSLRYVVGASAPRPPVARAPQPLALMLPLDDTRIDPERAQFEWISQPGAVRYRIEVESGGRLIATATTEGSRYRPPLPWLRERVRGDARWRVVALDGQGAIIAESDVRRFALR